MTSLAERQRKKLEELKLKYPHVPENTLALRAGHEAFNETPKEELPSSGQPDASKTLKGIQLSQQGLRPPQAAPERPDVSFGDFLKSFTDSPGEGSQTRRDFWQKPVNTASQLLGAGGAVAARLLTNPQNTAERARKGADAIKGFREIYGRNPSLEEQALIVQDAQTLPKGVVGGIKEGLLAGVPIGGSGAAPASDALKGVASAVGVKPTVIGAALSAAGRGFVDAIKKVSGRLTPEGERVVQEAITKNIPIPEATLRSNAMWRGQVDENVIKANDLWIKNPREPFTGRTQGFVEQGQRVAEQRARQTGALPARNLAPGQVLPVSPRLNRAAGGPPEPGLLGATDPYLRRAAPERGITGRNRQALRPVGGGQGFSMTDLNSFDDTLSVALQDNSARRLAQRLGNVTVGGRQPFKAVIGRMNPAAVAETFPEIVQVGRANLRDAGARQADIIGANLTSRGTQDVLFGATDRATGLINDGPYAGLSVNQIAENPSKYKLSTEQRFWLANHNAVEDDVLRLYQKNGIKINELPLEEVERYAGRRVVAKRLPDGEVVELGFAGGGSPGRIGAKTSTEKTRLFDTVDDAQKEGFVLMPYEEAVQLKIRNAYNRVADKKTADWIMQNLPDGLRFRTAKTPYAAVLPVTEINKQIQRADNLVKLARRVDRGEMLAPATSRAIRVNLPEFAPQMDAAMRLQGPARKKALKDIAVAAEGRAKALREQRKPLISARKNAGAAARRTAADEGSIYQPAFAGKMLTGGPQARPLADNLNRIFDPEQVNPILSGINKFNAVPRMFSLALDASQFSIQLLATMYRHPKAAFAGGKAWGQTLAKALTDENAAREFAASIIADNTDVLQRLPIITTQSGTEFTEALGRNGLLHSKTGLFGKATRPFRTLQVAYEASLDAAGVHMAKALEPLAKGDPVAMNDLVDYIDHMRGIASSKKLGLTANQRLAEAAVLLAPRYRRATAALYMDALQGGLRGELARGAFRNLILGLTFTVAATHIALSVQQGKSPKQTTTELARMMNPRDSRFMMFDFGGQLVGPGSKFVSDIRALSNFLTNPSSTIGAGGQENSTFRWVRSQLAGGPGKAIDLLRGRNFIGDTVGLDVTDPAKLFRTVGDIAIPIWIQAMLEEGGGLTDRAARGAAEFTGLRTRPQAATDFLDRTAFQQYNKRYRDLEPFQRREIRNDLSSTLTPLQERQAQRGGVLDTYFNESRKIEEEMQAEREAVAADKSKNRSDLSSTYYETNTAAYHQREGLSRVLNPEFPEPDTPEDKLINDWYALGDQAYINGTFSSDLLERLRNAFMNELEPDRADYLLRNTEMDAEDIPERMFNALSFRARHRLRLSIAAREAAKETQRTQQ
jgi:hypothetical protein